MSTRTPLMRIVMAALLVVPLAACLNWTPTSVSPQQWTPEERPYSVRTLSNAETMTLKDPAMRNDSLTGTIQGPSGSPWTVAVSDINTVEVRRLNAPMTILFGVIIPVLAIGMVQLNSCC